MNTTMTAARRTGEVSILGLSGSLRDASLNTTLLRAAARLAGPGACLHLWPDLAAVPPFNEDHESEPATPVHVMREAIAGANALLIATPEYNGSIPGQLKNALDWASRPYRGSVLTGKPVAVIGASPGDQGAAAAQAELRTVLRVAGARVLTHEFSLARAHAAFTRDGRLHEPGLRATLRDLLTALGHEAQTALEAA